MALAYLKCRIPEPHHQRFCFSRFGVWPRNLHFSQEPKPSVVDLLCKQSPDSLGAKTLGNKLTHMKNSGCLRAFEGALQHSIVLEALGSLALLSQGIFTKPELRAL